MGLQIFTNVSRCAGRLSDLSMITIRVSIPHVCAEYADVHQGGYKQCKHLFLMKPFMTEKVAYGR